MLRRASHGHVSATTPPLRPSQRPRFRVGQSGLHRPREELLQLRQRTGRQARQAPEERPLTMLVRLLAVPPPLIVHAALPVRTLPRFEIGSAKVAHGWRDGVSSLAQQPYLP